MVVSVDISDRMVGDLCGSKVSINMDAATRDGDGTNCGAERAEVVVDDRPGPDVDGEMAIAMDEIVVLPWMPLGVHLRDVGEGDAVYDGDSAVECDADEGCDEQVCAERVDQVVGGVQVRQVLPALVKGDVIKEVSSQGDSRGVGASTASVLDVCLGWFASICAGVLCYELLNMYPRWFVLVVCCIAITGWLNCTAPDEHLDQVVAGLASQSERLEVTLYKTLVQIKRCELNKRGYSITGMVPPISRIERNACLRGQSRDTLDCVSLRQKLLGAICDSRGVYSGLLRESTDRIPLLCELEDELRFLSNERCSFYRTEAITDGMTLSRASEVGTLLDFVLDKACTLSDPKYTAEMFRVLPVAKAVETKEQRLCNILLQLKTELASVETAIVSCVENASDNWFSREEKVLISVQQLQRNIKTFSCNSGVILEEALRVVSYRSVDPNDDEKISCPSTSDSVEEDENHYTELPPVTQNDKKFTQVFQGVARDDFGEERGVDCGEPVRNVLNEHRMLGELTQVIDMKRGSLAPEKIVHDDCPVLPTKASFDTTVEPVNVSIGSHALASELFSVLKLPGGEHFVAETSDDDDSCE
mmetsp:Transcript_20692/g.34133  ORF Transcript_20692/g.34133 Transcript_20692/m.34133 type:complete len:589 (+) Transcript_20692:105-1871(+)